MWSQIHKCTFQKILLNLRVLIGNSFCQFGFSVSHPHWEGKLAFLLIWISIKIKTANDLKLKVAQQVLVATKCEFFTKPKSHLVTKVNICPFNKFKFNKCIHSHIWMKGSIAIPWAERCCQPKSKKYNMSQSYYSNSNYYRSYSQQASLAHSLLHRDE